MNSNKAFMQNEKMDSMGSAKSLEDYVSKHLGICVSALYTRRRSAHASQPGQAGLTTLSTARLEDASDLVGGMLVCACVDGDADAPSTAAFEQEIGDTACAVM
jgi:hypothetical protein